MRSIVPTHISKDCLSLLLQGSLRAIPFNIISALLLVIALHYHRVPFSKIIPWISIVFIITLSRIILSKKQIAQAENGSHSITTLLSFIVLTFLMGLTWGVGYFIFLPYLAPLPEFIILLVLGGMCAGSIASLSIYMPAFYAYVLSMFIPVIIYNYYLNTFDRILLSSMFLLFILMLIITANINGKMLRKMVALSEDKQVLIEQLSSMSITDPLTGLYNRRYFDKTLKEELNRSKRNKYAFTLVFIDVDNFKIINDNLGHPSGDKFLTHVANVLKATFRRANDTVFRLGGDEFAAILVNTPLENAIAICNKIRDELSLHLHPKGLEIFSKITLSIGIVSIPHDSITDIEEIISKADQILYQAKKSGKNLIISADIG
ncbi:MULTISPECIES: GGDEF domain-containing protein [Legionella]|uniref:diguanylate cyclase n=1 Tax=Legionella septentrionalis TaxID=2498109 RepID=A0A433JIN6_9GAMM|nr:MULTISPECIES: GGDEF domain-containing protein [Legionella]MCP0913322.1 GGDEF domain-containing protein [Legionella sp. 27cVA30]RUQ85178.1 GGDEF domain-containing protein [Legionella septentrionalis]RUQ98000.1 GGDEF domain-containing protein [Legionella septentrionalis]RUR09026.1 GGDEF domain-containing protein [Legionella septentrionalis]RUR14680.1 GGDEF domain-containing protein [Legionella septentrionalis]